MTKSGQHVNSCCLLFTKNKRIMLRDKNANREFEASLSYEVKRI